VSTVAAQDAAAFRNLAARKPVVALVVGRNDVADFARSHTGALATSWRTTRAALRHAGAVLVDDERQLTDAVTALSALRLPPAADPGVGVVTAQAGPGLLHADCLRGAGVTVPALSTATASALRELLPPLTYQANPVDTGRPGETFAAVLRCVAADPAIALVSAYTLSEPDVLDPQAADLTGELAGRALLDGFHGGPVADRAAIGEILAALGDMLVANPALEAVEINPLRVTGQGLLALDAVVTLAEPAAPKETDHA
jgi:acyl-CoA synthetase (NDP forming)